MTREEEDAVLAQAKEIEERRGREYHERAQAVQARFDSGSLPFTDDELIYAAGARCKCGAGLAYPNGIGMFGAWGCSTLLKNGVRTLAGEHDLAFPFSMYSIKSEQQSSANGATTRPKPP